ncbi:MAG: hypothetical protein HQL98_00020 [Magnetococcales bacterium]|nr:hypothetical protein [Magnetococcales bacterium]
MGARHAFLLDKNARTHRLNRYARDGNGQEQTTGSCADGQTVFRAIASQRLTSDLKLPFQLDTTLFRTGETEVHEAIREALVNTLIHADHLGQGGIVVEKHRDRLEFSNPGGLLVSLDQLLRGNVSECRNKALQTMFMLIGTAEKAGSGVDKIFRGWHAQAWTLPTVNEQTQPDRVTWLLPLVTRQDHLLETDSSHSDDLVEQPG